MIKRAAAVGCSVLLLAVSLHGAAPVPSTVNWDALDASMAVPGELLVGFKQAPAAQGAVGIAAQVRANAHAAVGATVKFQYRIIACDSVTVPKGMSLKAAAALYQANPDVAYVEPNYIVHAYATPDDPLYPQLWGMARIHAPAAWDVVTGDTNVVVAVIDTGILRSHQDLAANIWENPGETGIDSNGLDRATNNQDDDGNGYIDDVHGWDFVNNDNDPTDDNGHGTHCSGTIGGVGNNAIGVAGVNWRVKLVGLKFLSASGSGATADAIRAVEYAVRMRNFIRLTSNSWGGGGFSQALKDAIDASDAAGQLFVAAAGNSASDNDASPGYPSGYSSLNIIAVASITVGGTLSGFSCYGHTSVDIGAPGSAILSTWNTSDTAYNTISGTSMATPHVAGACALLWAFAPGMSHMAIRDAILKGARPNPELVGKVATSGELDLIGALNQLGGSSIRLDRIAYRSVDTVQVRVRDPNNATTPMPVRIDCYQSDFVSVSAPGTLRSTATLDLTGPVVPQVLAGSFIPATLLAPPAQHGDHLVVTYTDPDGLGPSIPRDVTADAPIDDVPPVISNFATNRVTDVSVTVSWDTDEPANGYALASARVPPDTNTWVGSSAFAGLGLGLARVPHQVTVDGLAPYTPYMLAVMSSDPAGNVATFPADVTSATPSDYPRIISYGRIPVLSDRTEDGPGQWTHGGLKDCWELGKPGFGPPAAYSGTNCWGTNLRGNYPSIMNGWLMSPPLAVGHSPRIQFAQWYAMESEYDFGYLEVNAGAGWVDVTPYAFEGRTRLTGQSAGWELVTADLPLEFDNKTLQVRFRLQSDAIIQAAGWYIDDFIVSYSTGQGLFVSRVDFPVDDSAALSGANDGDGFPEAGETCRIRFRLSNTDVATHTNVTATVASSASGLRVSSGLGTLTYGTLVPGASAVSSDAITVTLTNNPLALPSQVPLQHVTRDAADGRWEQVVLLDVRRRDAISGMVTNLAGTAVTGATVSAMASGEPVVSSLTSTGGFYTLAGTIRGAAYSVWAGQPGTYSPSLPRLAMAPTSGVNLAVGRAFASVTPASLSIPMMGTYVAHRTLTIANTNVLADLPLRFTLDSDWTVEGIQVAFSQTNEVVVPVGAATNVEVVFRTAAIDMGTYDGHVLLRGNDVVTNALAVPVSLVVEDGPMLTISDMGLVDASGDGFCSAGESVSVSPVVFNSGLYPAYQVTGTLSFVGSSGVSVTQPDLNYADIGSGIATTPVASAAFQIDATVPEGTTLPFTVTLTDAFQYSWRTDFAVVVSNRYTISGQVSDALSTAGIPDVLVAARSGASRNALSALTDAGGLYAIGGVPVGVHTVSVAQVTGYASAPSQVITVNTASVTGVDFVLPPLALSYAPTGFVVTVKEGRETNGIVSITNESITGVEVTLRGEMGLGALQVPNDVAAAPVVWEALTAEQAQSDTFIVRFRDGTSRQAITAVSAALGGTVVRAMQSTPAVLIKTPHGVNRGELVQQYAGRADVQYVQPNYIRHAAALQQANRLLPDDTRFVSGELWGMDNVGQYDGTAGADIDAPEAWALTQGDTNVIVAVVDTGVNYLHPDLAANMWVNWAEYPTNGVDKDGNGFTNDVYGYDFVDNDGDPMDENDPPHGTHVAGTIGAVGNNATGVVGVCWRVRIMAVRGLGPGGGTDFDLANCLDYAVRMGAKVINNSWGGGGYSEILHEKIALAQANDVLCIFSAGNGMINGDGLSDDNDVLPSYPASDTAQNIISVAACDRNDLLAEFSNYGAESVDIAAPGVSILSTWNGVGGVDFDFLAGTSMAAPHVTGVAALLRAFAPNATWDMIKAAILAGAVPDARLAGKMVSGGHLNAYRAMRTLGAGWLAFRPPSVSLASGASGAVEVTFNAGATLPAGSYQADIILQSGSTLDNRIPVSLTVQPAPVPLLAGVRVDDSRTGDGDGYAEPGETIELRVDLHNSGFLLLNPSTGLLASSTPGVTIVSNALQWAGLPSGAIGTSTVPARVAFGGGTPSNAVFTLQVSDGVNPPWPNLQFTVDVATRYSITGRVTDAGTTLGIAGAVVEAFGTEAAQATTGTNGMYRMDGLRQGTVTLRARSAGYADAGWTNLAVSGDAGYTAALGAPRLGAAPSNLTVMVYLQSTGTTQVAVTNSGLGAWSGNAVELADQKVLLISDGTQLSGLEPLIRSMGLTCSNVTQNASLFYTASEGFMARYDIVIADLSGSDGLGRKVLPEEALALEAFAARGRHLIVTGRNILGAPDNQQLAATVGSMSVGLAQPVMSRNRGVVGSDDAMFRGPLVTVPSGAVVAVTAQVYDGARADTNLAAESWLAVGGADKIIHRRVSGGDIVYWSGNVNGTEWSGSGVLQDVLRNLLFNWAQADIDWLSTSAGTQRVTVATAVVTNIQLTADARQLNVPTTNRAVLLMLGAQVGGMNPSVSVTMITVPPSLQVLSSTGVRRWDGTWLAGDGSETSCLFQVIYAGPNGSNDVARRDGGTSGDDVLLGTVAAGVHYGRLGDGYEWMPDFGRFRESFGHTLSSGAVVFVRAWDAATFEGAAAYGDSTRYPLAVVFGESHDFGTWVVDRTPGYPGTSLTQMGDQDGDSIPDGYAILQGLNPRNTIQPLAGAVVARGQLGTGAPGSGLDQLNLPVRVAVSSNRVYIADSGNNRVLVRDRSLTNHCFEYTGFLRPRGIAINAAGTRLAVADTEHSLVKVYDIVPGTGALVAYTNFGGFGSTLGKLNKPYAVAFAPSGRIYVADSHVTDTICNHRLQAFNPDGTAPEVVGGPGVGPGQFNRPLGIDVHPDGAIYVADGANQRIQTLSGTHAYFGQMGTTLTPGNALGSFDWPVDVHAGLNYRLYVADRNNHRIQVFDVDPAQPVAVVGAFGIPGDLPGEFNYPQGVTPTLDSRDVYVADTQNHRVQRLTLVMDRDGDGMDDVWEDLNGLNSRDGSDGKTDADHDGLLNIGEFRLGTDPQRFDSNGNGAGDGWDLVHGLNPLQAGGPVMTTPRVLSFFANPSGTARAGDIVRVFATFTKPVTNAPVPTLTLNGGATLAPTAMVRGGPSVYFYDYQVSGAGSGVVNGAVSGAFDLGGLSLDPDPTTATALFTVAPTVLSITNITTGLSVGVAWNAVSGGIYRVEAATGLLVPDWVDDGTVTVTSNGVKTWTSAMPTNRVRFYRVIWTNP